MELSIKDKINAYLFKEVSPLSNALFRFFFGILMFFQFYYIEPYIVENLTLSKYLLKYDFFEWVNITTVNNLKVMFNVALVFSFFYAIGFLYRFSSIVIFFIWTYIFLLDVGHYNNHYYLNSLLLFTSIFVQADATFSVKSIFFSSKLIPKWNVDIFKFQMFVVYFYGAIAKLNKDWLNGIPLKYWLGEDFSLLGILSPDTSFVFMAWYGLLFDFFIGFMLYHKKLKFYSLLFILPFHITNHFIWTIGTFPWMAISICVFYFNEELTNLFKMSRLKFVENKSKWLNSSWFKYPVLLYVAIQILMPLRQHLIKGETSWHGYGNYFAWRMMLADKQGAAKVVLFSENNQKLGDIQIEEYMNVLQFARMIHLPMHFVKFAHFLDHEITKHPQNAPLGDVKVKVYAFKTINNRPFSLLIDTTMDLSNIEYKIMNRGDYIIPFKDKEIKEELDVLYEDEYLQFK
ncbi:MAG: HTTM domain-containing protein [Flavobacteriales bacterium]|jgi:hypothetical protein|nr:HTTM domain-containing protein [Flavobacteriales bacterium]